MDESPGRVRRLCKAMQFLDRPQTKVVQALPPAAAVLLLAFASIIYKTSSGRRRRQLRLPSDTKRPGLPPNCTPPRLPMANLMARFNYSVTPTDRRPNAVHLQGEFKSLMRWLVQFAPPTYFAYFCSPVMFQRKCKTCRVFHWITIFRKPFEWNISWQGCLNIINNSNINKDIKTDSNKGEPFKNCPTPLFTGKIHQIVFEGLPNVAINTIRSEMDLPVDCNADWILRSGGFVS